MRVIRYALLLLGVLTSLLVGPPAGASHLIPSPAAAIHDEPPIYYNGCHSWPPRTAPLACTYSHPKGKRTVMLLGDSHAAHWFGAVRGVSRHQGYRFLSLTKSSCPAVDVFVRRYRVSTFHTSCRPWRKNVFAKMRRGGYGRLDVIVMSSWHFHQVTAGAGGPVVRGARRAQMWRTGMSRTLKVLTRNAGQVIILRDSPQLPGGMQGYWRCIANNQHAPRRCGTSVKKALSARLWRVEKQVAAKFPTVSAVDLSTPFCKGGFCSPVDGRHLAFKDDNHFNQTYMHWHFQPLLRPLVKSAMAQAREDRQTGPDGRTTGSEVS